VGGILLAWGMSRLEATLHNHGDHDHGAASSHEGHDHGAPASSTDGHDHGSHDGHDH